MIVNAKEFAKKTGYPIAMIRTYCREGKLSYWRNGKVYLLDEEVAWAEMQEMKEKKVNKKSGLPKHRVERNIKLCTSGEFDYRATIRRMQAECREK